MQEQQRFARLAAGFAFAALLGSVVSVASGRKPRDWSPTIDPAKFTTQVENSYFPLVPGKTLTYQQVGGTTTMTVEITNQVKVVMGVPTVVVRETHTENGQVVAISENWYAQDQEGNVWNFGEQSQTYANGVPSGTEGSWEAGVDGAQPGVVMEANPQHGDTYFQEFAQDVAEDMATVLATTETVTVPASTFTNVLRTREWSPLEGANLEHKFYAPGVGLIMEQDKTAQLVLVACN